MSMLTQRYRGYWIHCTSNRAGEVCRIQAPDLSTKGTSRSVEGAKKKIRKLVGPKKGRR